ncbi:MAG: 4-hydroxy-3-methylbut-2-enyl diphosphate reductase [Candidatus Eisenbacteria bacterium]|nr:4-hydroxy-3-methylbut-2-enyl diphosphate reductase [Candidatus Eisenbacteria bacterium]
MANKPQQGAYHRKAFGRKDRVERWLEHDFHSELVELIKADNYRLEAGGLTILLAREFGFCYGVDRALDYAYETRERFADKRIFITGEVIHNPRVNEQLEEMGILYLPPREEAPDRLEQITPEDVVLLPAFGAERDDVERLRALGCTIVDTTCGSVLLVWKSVERYARDGYTAIVHGKHWHEETRATCSQVSRHPQGRYLVLLDLEEAHLAADMIRGRLDPAAFRERFAPAVSPGFDPQRDLVRIGLANQTTMLSSESLAVGEVLKQAMIDRYGAERLEEHFRSFDTICSATQERQDAIEELLEKDLDLMLIVGGYNSSNTGHLAEITSERVPTFHVEGARDFLAGDTIRHLPVGATEPVVSRHWLPEGPVRIGLSAGASTPDRQIGRVVDHLLAFRDVQVEAILASRRERVPDSV